MTPLKNGGELVDFKENIIFEKEKNNPLKNSEKFKYRCIKEYGFKGSTTNLYRKIVNYQIKKYGKTLNNSIDMLTLEEKFRKCVIKRQRRNKKLKGRRTDEK